MDITTDIQQFDYAAMVEALLGTQGKTERHFNPLETRLLLAAIGFASEAGEALDVVKKMLFHHVGVTPEYLGKLLGELGDARWYYQAYLNALDATDGGILRINTAKLKARYPQGTFDFDRFMAKEHQAGADADPKAVIDDWSKKHNHRKDGGCPLDCPGNPYY